MFKFKTFTDLILDSETISTDFQYFINQLTNELSQCEEKT